MPEDILTLSYETYVAVHETDFAERLKPGAILQYFQDIASAHAQKLGVGYRDMLDKNLYWVISRMSCRVYKFPAIGEKITVRTYPKKPSRADVDRDYYIDDSCGNLLISGSSKWCVIDSGSRTLKRCDNVYTFPEERYFDKAPFDDTNPRLKPLESYDADIVLEKQFSVNITDLDRNRHMNNARYADTILNCCSIEKIDKNKIVSFDINFLSELKWGDDYIVRRKDIGNTSVFEAYKISKDTACGQSVFRVRVEWDA